MLQNGYYFNFYRLFNSDYYFVYIEYDDRKTDFDLFGDLGGLLNPKISWWISRIFVISLWPFGGGDRS